MSHAAQPIFLARLDATKVGRQVGIESVAAHRVTDNRRTDAYRRSLNNDAAGGFYRKLSNLRLYILLPPRAGRRGRLELYTIPEETIVHNEWQLCKFFYKFFIFFLSIAACSARWRTGLWNECEVELIGGIRM